MTKRKSPEAAIVPDGKNLFIVFDGKRIARRGRPGTPQAGTWVSIEPGYSVLDSASGDEIVIEYNGVRVH
jgi:hypothetical protein